VWFILFNNMSSQCLVSSSDVRFEFRDLLQDNTNAFKKKLFKIKSILFNRLSSFASRSNGKIQYVHVYREHIYS